MSSERYDVVLAGFPNGTSTGEEPDVALARVFDIPLEKAQRYIARMPVVVRRNAEMGVARHYVNALVYIGALFELRPVDDGAPEEVRSDRVSNEHGAVAPRPRTQQTDDQHAASGEGEDPSHTQMRGGVPVNMLPKGNPAMMGDVSIAGVEPGVVDASNVGGSTQFAPPRRLVETDPGQRRDRHGPNFDLGGSTSGKQEWGRPPADGAPTVDPPARPERSDGALFDAAWTGLDHASPLGDVTSDHDFDVSGSFFSVSSGGASPGDAALSGEHAWVDPADDPEPQPAPEAARGLRLVDDADDPGQAAPPTSSASHRSTMLARGAGPAVAPDDRDDAPLELDFEAANRRHESGHQELWRGPESASASKPRIETGTSPPSASVAPRQFHSAEVGLPEGFGVSRTAAELQRARIPGQNTSGPVAVPPIHPVYGESKPSGSYVTHVSHGEGVLPEGFVASLPHAFLFPLRGTGMVWIGAICGCIVGSVVLMSLGAIMFPVGIMLMASAFGIFAGTLTLQARYFMASMSGAAYDGDGPDGAPDMSDFLANLAWPGMQLLLFTCVLFMPAGWYMQHIGRLATAGQFFMFAVLAFLPWYYWPMALTMYAREGNGTGLWNVIRGAQAILTAPLHYTALVFVGFVAWLVSVWCIGALASVSTILKIVGFVLSGVPLAYTAGVCGTLMGKLLQENPEMLGD